MPIPKSDPRVDAYIDALPDWQQAICREVRALVHRADADIEETIKRTRQPYFVLDGNVCALLATKDHVNVFLYDPIVADPAGIVTGGHDNKSGRTMAVYEGEEDQRAGVRGDDRRDRRQQPRWWMAQARGRPESRPSDFRPRAASALTLARARVEGQPTMSASVARARTRALSGRGHASGASAIWVPYGVLAAMLLAYLGYLIARPISESSTLIDGWLLCAVEIVASGLCIARGVRRKSGRLVPLLLGASILSWSLGDVALTAESLGGASPPTRRSPTPSIWRSSRWRTWES